MVNPLNIEEIQVLFAGSAVVLTQHFLEKIRKRSIALSDVRSAVESGTIVEFYPEDYPHPSALILGYAKNLPLHIVVGIGGGFAWLITSYRPDADKWEDDYKTRKEIT